MGIMTDKERWADDAPVTANECIAVARAFSVFRDQMINFRDRLGEIEPASEDQAIFKAGGLKMGTDVIGLLDDSIEFWDQKYSEAKEAE